VIRLEQAILDGLGMVCDFTDLGRFVSQSVVRRVCILGSKASATRVRMAPGSVRSR
jgi:hypothetical protein